MYDFVILQSQLHMPAGPSIHSLQSYTHVVLQLLYVQVYRYRSQSLCGSIYISTCLLHSKCRSSPTCTAYVAQCVPLFWSMRSQSLPKGSNTH